MDKHCEDCRCFGLPVGEGLHECTNKKSLYKACRSKATACVDFKKGKGMKNINGTVTVKNVSDYVTDEKYIVAKLVNGELWFWGAWDDKKSADKAAQTMPDMIVVEVK